MTLQAVSALALAFVLSSAEAGQTSTGFSPYRFKTADGIEIQGELGHFDVPENRRSPSSGRLKLAFLRLRSTNPKPGPPIVYLAGGPGNSGISTLQGSRYPLFEAMRAVADVIAWDQRGTGRSEPNLRCPQTLDYPLAQPGERQAILERYIRKSRECAEFHRAKGVDLTGYNTNESADDLDELRRVLGIRRISLLATSYGTHLALAAIRRHESHVHKVILAGVEGVDATIKYPSAVEQSLARVAELARSDDEIRKTVPDLVALVDRVLRRLQKEHLTVELNTSGGQPSRKVVLGSFDVGWVTSSYIMAFPAVSTLPTLYRALDAGDVTHPEVQRMASAIAAFRTGSIGSAMSIMMDCYSGVAEDRYGRILREEQQTVLGRLIDFPFPEACTAWGSPDLGAKFRRPVRSRVPALLFSGDLDARTPPSSAEATMAGLVNAKHIVITRGMHGDSYFLASPEIRERMAAFLRGDEISTRSIEAPALRFLP